MNKELFSSTAPSSRSFLRCLLVLLAASFSTETTIRHAYADEPIALQQEWTGKVDFFVTGAPLAIDADGNGSVDESAQPASVDVTADDIPAGATLVKAYLFWAGTMSNNDCAGPPNFDDTVTFTAPGQTPVAVAADVSYCSDGGAAAFDVQSHRADVTSLIDAITGTYTVDDFTGLWSNGSSDNGSFSIVLVYEQSSLPRRTVALYDGLETFSESSRTFTHSNIEISSALAGNLAFHVLDGDTGGTGNEEVEVASPSATPLVLSDSVNPVGNPMNHTINTTNPASANTIGVDIDTFPIGGGLNASDSAFDVTFSAGTDRWWLAHFVVGVDVTPLPEITVSLVTGPLADDGFGTLSPFDVNGDGFVDGADEGNLIGVGLGHSQYFVYDITITNPGPSGSLDDFAILDILPDGFRLSSVAETGLTPCTGNDCDGVNVWGICTTTISGPKGKKNTIDPPRYLTVELSGLATAAHCTATVYVETTNGGRKGKHARAFEPETCEVAATSAGTLNNTVSLDEGAKVFDTVTGAFLSGPVASIQLVPQGCP